MALPDGTQAPDRPSLYDRLGGVYNIAPVVDDLIDRVMVDPRLNANPRVDEAHHRVSAAGFKYFVIEMLLPGPWSGHRQTRRKFHSREATRAVVAAYPPRLRSWIRRHGRLTNNVILLRGSELSAFYPRCRR